MCESVGKADLLSDHFDSKQSRESVDLLVTCHPSPSFSVWWCFDGFFVWVVSLLAGDRPVSPQFQKVHCPPLLPITNQFPYHQYCPRCLSIWWRFVLDNLWNTVVCFQPPSLLIGKVSVNVMHFCVCHIHCRVHWRADGRPGLCRSTSGDR